MSQKPRSSIPHGSPTAGTARLSIVVLVTVVSLIYSMPADLRSTAMGWGIALSATGGSIFGFVTNGWMTADAVGFDSARPFELAALLGLIGATGLFIFDRISPIRRAVIAAPA